MVSGEQTENFNSRQPKINAVVCFPFLGGFHAAVDLFNKSKQTQKQKKTVNLGALLLQVTEGDCKKPQPDRFRQEAHGKWVEWKTLDGMTMPEGIDVFMKLVTEVGKDFPQKLGHKV